MLIKRLYNPPPFDMISSAAQGSIVEIGAVLRHYKRYMTALSLRPFRDKNGNIKLESDTEILYRMESRLIERILKFKFF